MERRARALSMVFMVEPLSDWLCVSEPRWFRPLILRVSRWVQTLMPKNRYYVSQPMGAGSSCPNWGGSYRAELRCTSSAFVHPLHYRCQPMGLRRLHPAGESTESIQDRIDSAEIDQNSIRIAGILRMGCWRKPWATAASGGSLAPKRGY